MFKTVEFYEAQPVILGTDKVRELMASYVNVIRPFVAIEGEDEDTAYLFLNLNGTPDKNLGRHVSAYYLKHLNLKIDTTTVRKIADTTAADLLRRGLLNQEQVDGCHFVNGHSARTAQDYYVQ